MNIQTKQTQLDSELTLWESSGFPIKIHVLTIELTKEVHKIKDCRLKFQVTPEQYQLIETEALFNLKPEIRTPISGKPFQPSFDIQIEASLEPDLLPQLTKHAKTSNQAIAYLQNLNQEQPDHPLLSTYSWYALEVKQQQEKGETGYRTLWAYFNPSHITKDGINSEKLNEAMLDFTKNLMNTNHSGTSEEAISQAVEQITHTFEDLTTDVSDITQKVVSETIEQMNATFAEVAESISEITETTASKNSIFEVMTNFFSQENWQFQANPENQVISLGFQGKNGLYDCCAIARTEQQQIAFYSILPIQTPENKRNAVAEFIARANYGIIIGNFELDFADGEIRYKTSLDFEGNGLNFDLIQSLVYANVTMMDEYLPGIIAVIESDVSPEKAIEQIEV